MSLFLISFDQQYIALHSATTFQHRMKRARERGISLYPQYLFSRIMDECKLTWNTFLKYVYSFWLYLCNLLKYSAHVRRLRETAIAWKFFLILVINTCMASDNLSDVTTRTVSHIFLSSVLPRRRL